MPTSKTTEPQPAAEAPTHPPIAAVLAKVAEEVGAVAKSGRFNGPGGGYAFRGIDAVVNAVSGPLHRAGVIVMPKARSVQRGTATTAKGGQINTVTVEVDYTFHGPAGDKVTARVFAEAFDSGDKATTKAMSVAFRIALLQVLTLPTDEPDPDAEAYDARPNAEQITPELQEVAESVADDVLTAVDAHPVGSERQVALREAWQRAEKVGVLAAVVRVPDAWTPDEPGQTASLADLIKGALGVVVQA